MYWQLIIAYDFANVNVSFIFGDGSTYWTRRTDGFDVSIARTYVALTNIQIQVCDDAGINFRRNYYNIKRNWTNVKSNDRYHVCFQMVSIFLSGNLISECQTTRTNIPRRIWFLNEIEQGYRVFCNVTRDNGCQSKGWFLCFQYNNPIFSCSQRERREWNFNFSVGNCFPFVKFNPYLDKRLLNY